jgi:hypothetical protein
MVVSSAYLGFPGLGLEESGFTGRTHPHVVSGGIAWKRTQKNVILWVEPRALGIVGVNGVPSYGVLLASAWILRVEWAWLDYMCLHHKFYDSRSFLWYTGICVCSSPCYVFLCVCEYDMSTMYVVWWYVFAQQCAFSPFWDTNIPPTSMKCIIMVDSFEDIPTSIPLNSFHVVILWWIISMQTLGSCQKWL